jgi:hypothetical protein
MKKRLAPFVAVLAFVVAAPAAPAPADPPQATTAHRCSAGYTHARIGGEHKCLRRGQFCARRYDRQYHRYGFHCHSRRLR